LAFAIFLPGGDPRLRCLLVNAERQARHADGTDETVVDRERQSARNEIDLARGIYS
jgi:hypothetical protein